jgi:MGT family glycosyltransferase
MGPLLDAPPLMRRADTIALQEDGRPLVVVSLSTSDQGQLPLLQRIIEALGGVDARVVVTTGPAVDPASIETGGAGNVQVVRFVPHERLLLDASLVITHAGLGTVMTTLARGVPLLCVPLGRDQFFNAARVAALGVGRVVSADADASAIAEAIRDLLADAGVRAAAGRFAEIIAGYENGARAIRELEQLAVDRRACAVG